MKGPGDPGFLKSLNIAGTEEKVIRVSLSHSFSLSLSHSLSLFNQFYDILTETGSHTSCQNLQ